MPELNNLPYPLNIYASIFSKENGSVRNLCYGIFDSPDESISVAQDRAVDLLRAQLPPAAKILEVGCVFGTFTNALTLSGYSVTGITSYPEQIEFARFQYGDSLKLKCISFEDFCEDEGSWDVLLLHESCQYIPMLIFFEKASILLKKEGQIIVLDEFARKRTEPGLERLHHKDYFLTLAQRFGFTCLDDTDYTLAVQPMLDFIVYSLEKHRVLLASELDINPSLIDALVQANYSHREKYLNGRFGYFLLHLQRQHLPKWRLSLLKKEDQPAVSDLFEKVFDQPFSPEMWSWKYGPGRGHAIGLWEKDSLIAHYGGIPRLLSVAGTNIMASQSCDAMVAPHVRGSFVRKGPFFQVCATYVEHFVGYGTNQPLAFGFANERSFRLPRKLGVYTDPVTKIREYSWGALESKSKMWTIRPIDISSLRDASLINALWQQMDSELQPLVVGVRDSAYLCGRYKNHPQYTYEMYLVYQRWLRKPLAVVIVKKEGQRLELLDWVAGVKNISKVVMAARLLAAKAAVRDVCLLASLPVGKYLSETSPKETDAKIVVPYNAWTNAPDTEVLQDKLWLTGGDTDYH